MDKDLLFKPRLPEADVDVPGVGTVRLRGLSRLDVLAIRQADTEAPGAFERALLAASLIDPEMTEDEVERWQRASGPDELELVTAKAVQLSALSKQASKEAYEEFEADPDSEFQFPPGEGPGDDGGPHDGGDE